MSTTDQTNAELFHTGAITPADAEEHDGDRDMQNGQGGGAKYGRFAAMIATSMTAMFLLTYTNTYRFDDVRFSETRFYMTFVMGSVMAIIMLGFMLGMYRNRRVNAAIFVGSTIVFSLALWIVRSQATVDDESYMRAMIPHHSIAILTSTRANFADVRVQRLATDISEAQKREIEQMNWLLADIAENGTAGSEAEADQRPVPEFTTDDYDD